MEKGRKGGKGTSTVATSCSTHFKHTAWSQTREFCSVWGKLLEAGLHGTERGLLRC